MGESEISCDSYVAEQLGSGFPKAVRDRKPSASLDYIKIKQNKMIEKIVSNMTAQDLQGCYDRLEMPIRVVGGRAREPSAENSSRGNPVEDSGDREGNVDAGCPLGEVVE